MSFLDFDLGKAKRKRPRPKQTAASKGINNVNKANESIDKASKRLFQLAERKRLQKQKEEFTNARQKKIDELRLVKESNGIDVKQVLKPYPISKGNTNKVFLPPSFLENLMQQANIEELTPICVEIGIDQVGTTFSGVAEFSAPEGSVGLPFKTALSLTKDIGLNLLEKAPVTVRYVRLPVLGALNIKLRPKGRGFFTTEGDVVDIDVKTVLEKTLNEHVAVGLNDWIPIYANGTYITLSVEQIQATDTSIDLKEVIEFDDLANSVDLDEIDREDLLFEYTPKGFVILNSDIQVQLLPSEADQKQLDEKRDYEDLVAKVNFRLNTITNKEVTINSSGNDIINFKFKFPNGHSVLLKIDATEKLRVVFDWIFSQIAGLKLDYEKLNLKRLLLDEYPFRVEFPKGVKAVVDFTQDSVLETSLTDLQFSRRTLLIVSFPLKSMQIEKQTPKDMNLEEISRNSLWEAAYANLALSDQKPSENEFLAGKEEKLEIEDTEVQEIYNELSQDFQIPTETAWTVATKYGSSIIQLKEMGFGPRLGEAVPFLIKYQGRVLRVSNALLGNT